MSDTGSPDTLRPDSIFRVLLLARSASPFHGYGGLERHVGDLVTHLLNADVGITLITRPPQNRTPATTAFLARRGLDVEFVPYRTFPFAGRRGTTVLDRSTAYPWFGWRAGRAGAARVAHGGIDIVHGLGASALGYAIARRRDQPGTAPFVFNPQGLEEFGASGTLDGVAKLKRIGYAPLQAAVRTCARAADRVIATDRALEPAVRHHLGVSRERMCLIPNAIDLELSDRAATAEDGARLRRSIDLLPDEPLLLSVGRIEHSKGFHLLVRALADLRAWPWRWALVGDGPFRPAIERMLAEHELRSRVILTGRVDEGELHGWYEAATIFVHPTLYEGSSLVTLEAMAHRRAVVSTRAGGIPDKVSHGVNGWLVDPGQPEPLSAALRIALADRGRLAGMGAAGRRIVEASFSWPVVADRLIDVYRELLRARGKKC